MRRSELSPADLQALEAKITADTERLNNVQVEIRVVEASRERLRAEVDSEREAAITKRRQELAVIESEHADRLKPIQAEVATLKATTPALVRRNEQLKSQAGQLEVDLVDARLTLANIVQERADALEAFASAKTTMLQIQNKITYLESQVDPLLAQQTSLRADVAILDGQKVELEAAISTLSSEFESNKAKYEQELSKLEFKHTELANDLVNEQQQVELGRKQLAERELALDARDENIRRREYKIERDEARVAQNAGLLNL